jgi:predicted kinase
MTAVTPTRILVAMTGLPATGKSAIADAIGRALPAPVFSVDPLEATLNRAGITREHRSGHAAYDLAAMLAEAQLRAGQSAVVDAVNGYGFVRTWWSDIAARHHAPLLTIATICSDRAQHRRQLERRTRAIDGFLYDVTWAEVEASMEEYEPATDADLVLDAVDPLDTNVQRALDCIATVLADTE